MGGCVCSPVAMTENTTTQILTNASQIMQRKELENGLKLSTNALKLLFF
jgi:hypothetical protein